jgi:UDP-glucose 4-epimerase
MNSKEIKNKRIFLTGGAGFLGKNLIKNYYENNDLTVYSRDEAKHYFLKKKYPKVNFIIGDVRNYDLMLKSSKGHNIGIFAASLKQIEAVDQNIEESVQTIIFGALNSRKVCEENEFEAGCFVSSDKSRAATTLYGSMKFVAGESFITNAEKNKVNLSSVIYGNVMNSTGSLIPLIWDAIKNKYELTLYSEEMTRFKISIKEAINLIENALNYNGYNLIPKIDSFLIKDVFEIYKNEFGLKYRIGKPRISEKIHEIMACREELPRMKNEKDYYLMHYKTIFNELNFINNEYSSKDFMLSQEQLFKYLKENNFFNNED